MAGALPVDRALVAIELDEHHSVLQLSADDPQGDLHDECDRVDAGTAPQGHARPRSLPEPGVGAQGPLPGNRRDIEKMEAADQRLSGSPQSLLGRVRGKDPGVGNEPVTQKSGQSRRAPRRCLRSSRIQDSSCSNTFRPGKPPASCCRRQPRYPIVSVSGYPLSEGGA